VEPRNPQVRPRLCAAGKLPSIVQTLCSFSSEWSTTQAKNLTIEATKNYADKEMRSSEVTSPRSRIVSDLQMHNVGDQSDDVMCLARTGPATPFSAASVSWGHDSRGPGRWETKDGDWHGGQQNRCTLDRLFFCICCLEDRGVRVGWDNIYGSTMRVRSSWLCSSFLSPHYTSRISGPSRGQPR